MPCIWICQACTGFSFFQPGSEKSKSRIFFPASGAQRRGNTTCATPSAAISSIYSVYLLLRDPPPGSRYCRFAYSVGVVHFRKYCYSGKIGSPGNRRPVIRFRFYKPGCNCIWLKL
ncbi:hypothetical protein F9E79_20500 [Salmonella enterica]|nr:hypothetical protein [Salmonella enterica]